MNRKQSVLFLAAALAAVGSSATALADIGINVRRGAGQHPIDAADAAGLVPQLNWNNNSGASAGTNAQIAGPVAGQVVDHNGVPIASLSLAWYGNGTWSAPNGDGLPGAGDADLMAGYLDDTGTFGMTRVDVSGIPYAHYDVIAYLGSDGNGRTGEVALLNYGITRFTTNSSPFPGYVANPPAGFPVSAGNSNAVRFSGISGSSFILTNRRISNNVGLHGLQIVEMPGPAPPAPVIPAAFEVGHWAFEGNALDSSGLDNHGAEVGGAGYAAGRFGQALSLSGGGQYVQVSGDSLINPNFAGLQPPQYLAVSAWVKSAEPANDAGEILSLGDHYGLRVNGNRSLHFFQDINPSGNSWLGLTTASAMPSESITNDGNWHHIVAQKTGTHLEVYVDGVLALGSLATGSESLMPTQDLIDYAQLGTDLFFGRHGNGSTTLDFNGMIDEVRIFQGQLTPQEVNNLMQFNSLVPEPATGLLAVLAAAGVLWAARGARRSA